MVVMLPEGRGRFSKELGVGGLELFTVDAANSCPAYAATFWNLGTIFSKGDAVRSIGEWNVLI
jgi:hypothetical protein